MSVVIINVVVKTDKGGENISNEFLDYCRENAIHKQFTTRHKPKQNGITEIKK